MSGGKKKSEEVAKKVLQSCRDVLFRRRKIFVMLNMLSFDCIFLGVLLGQFFYAPLPYMEDVYGSLIWFRGLDWPWMILAIFISNLALSGFIFSTLPGLVFFPFSVIFLAMRGVSWGIMSNQPSVVPLLLVIPTFILEGEGYVLASMAGTILGLSWLKPDWIYKDEYLSRLDALKTALREAISLLFLSATILLLGAVVETLTIKGV